MGRDETWPLRSITKSFTVTLSLQLADEGQLDLDDPVGAYVDGVPNGKRVTLRDLAAMTSGLPDHPTPAFGADLLADPTRIFRPDELLAYAWREPLHGPAGGAAVCTNSKTVLLDRVVEAVSGTSFAQVLRQRILRPLRLDHTLATPDARRWPEPRPVGYQLENGEPPTPPAAQPLHLRGRRGDGGPLQRPAPVGKPAGAPARTQSMTSSSRRPGPFAPLPPEHLAGSGMADTPLAAAPLAELFPAAGPGFDPSGRAITPGG